MSNSFNFQDVAKALKPILRERKISYKQLAKKLGVSESSVKKLFISNDCSLYRLAQICDFLEIEMSELLKVSQEQPIKKLKFTQAQEKFLIQDKTSLHIYWKLVYEGYDLSELKSVFKIEDKVLHKHLRLLDKHDLIQLLPDGKLKFPDMEMVLWEDSGELVRKIKHDWSINLIREVANSSNLKDHHFSMRYYELKPETLIDFIRAVTELEFEFGRRSAREMKFNAKDTIRVSMVTALAPKSFVNHL